VVEDVFLRKDPFVGRRTFDQHGSVRRQHRASGRSAVDAAASCPGQALLRLRSSTRSVPRRP
jgi:hypothetical protein